MNETQARGLEKRNDDRVSVIIPALNEVAYLPHLLDALAVQTRPADEIIVADAGSTDGTPELAQARGARVVGGGIPAVGRNAGAKVAKGELLFFLDADVVPPSDFLERAVTEFVQKGYDVATVVVTPWDGNRIEQVVHEAANLYFLLMQSWLPYAPGYCILVRREIHEKIGGFDETLTISEDLDYVRRAARHGRFGILTSTCIPVSMRRIRREGLIRLGMKYLWGDIHLLMAKPMRQLPFKYEFGIFSSPVSENSPEREARRFSQHWGGFPNFWRSSGAAGQELLPWRIIRTGKRPQDFLRLGRHRLISGNRFLQRR
jgi:glycosyltransferase involved in cell wall biosynthesis